MQDAAWEAYKPPSPVLSSGGDLRDGDHADEIPGVAPVRLLPGAGVGLQAPDGGHAGGEALRHRGGGGPADRHLRQQHRALPPAVQQDRNVSDGSPERGLLVSL